MSNKTGLIDERETRVQPPPGAFPDDDRHTVETNAHSLSQAVHARSSEYLRPRQVRIRIGSWNVGALENTETDLEKWFVQEQIDAQVDVQGGVDDKSDNQDTVKVEASSSEPAGGSKHDLDDDADDIPSSPMTPTTPFGEIGLYVLGLQEIVNIASVQETMRPDVQPVNKWKRAVEEALPTDYVLVAEQQLVGLLLLIYASPLVHDSVSSVSTTTVGTGFMGYMGNKGAVLARLVLGETTRLVFVNCHLAAGVEKADLARRNWDVAQITNRAHFEPVKDGLLSSNEAGENIGREDFTFWFGDLNYRVDTLPGDDVRRLLSLHTRTDIEDYVRHHKRDGSIDARAGKTPFYADRGARWSSKSSETSSITHLSIASTNTTSTFTDVEDSEADLDPTSLQTTLSSLLPHDQLRKQMHRGTAFKDGWREGKINFLPTYKYDVGSRSMFDTSEKKRPPSWCDRILFRTKRSKAAYDRKVKEDEDAKKRDEEIKAQSADKATSEDEVLFEYNPETDGDRKNGDDDEDDYNDADWDPMTLNDGLEDDACLEEYKSHQVVVSSDHKPLSASFLIRYDAVDSELKSKVQEQVVKVLDRAENEGRPVVTIAIDQINENIEEEVKLTRNTAAEGVNFGPLSYLRPKTSGLTVANTGPVPATFGFIDRPVPHSEQGGATPPWLSVRFDRSSNKKPGANDDALHEYTLEPGDALYIELQACIDDVQTIRKLTNEQSQIEEILVLRVQNGRDYFIPLRATLLPTCFGQSFESLLRLPEGGIREGLPMSAHDESERPQSQVKRSAPRELFVLTQTIEELTERAVAEWGILHNDAKPPWEESHGWPFERSSWKLMDSPGRTHLASFVREALDKGEPIIKAFPTDTSTLHRVEVVAETMMLFLKDLEDGLITEPMWQEISSGLTKASISRDAQEELVLDILSKHPARSVSFTFVTFMLTRIINEVAPLYPQPSRSQRSSTESKRRSRANTLNQDPRKTRRQAIEKCLTDIFSDLVIRTPKLLSGKEKKTCDQKKRQVLEIFIAGKLDYL